MKKPESFSSAVIFTSALSYQLKISPDSGRKTATGDIFPQLI